MGQLLLLLSVQTIVCQLNGVDSLLLAISNAGDRQEIVERCVCSLRHITSRHPGADAAQLSIREANGIPMLMNLLQPQTRWPMIKVADFSFDRTCKYIRQCLS